MIASKQWRDAAEPFHFPETITSVSYSLRKAYINHLWDYEQVYFFRRQGPRLVSPAGTANVGTGGFEDDLSRPGKKRKTNDVVATSFPAVHPCSPITLTAASTGPGSPTAAAVGQRGTVVVESRFDAGYFVAVRIGKQDFRGMLYFPPAESTTLVDLTPLAQPRRAGRPRKEERQDGARVIKKEKSNRDRDPMAPKPNKTPFNFFSVDARVKAKDVYPAMSQTDITKKVGEMWQTASEEEKSPYVAMSNQDKARYQAELESYNFRLASQAAAQQASQAAVAVSAAQHAMASQPLQVLSVTPDTSSYLAERVSLRREPQTRGKMAKYGPVVLISGVLVLLDIAAFFVLLGSASAIQHHAQAITTLTNANSGIATYFDLMPQNSPQRLISFEWFKAVFQILTLLFCAAVLASGQVYRFRMAMIGLLAVLASLWCDACQTFYYIHLVLDSLEGPAMIPGVIVQSVRGYFSGCIMSAALNLALIITLGTGVGQAVPLDTYASPKDTAYSSTATTAAQPVGTV
ncbi:hypothetical protein WJX84_009244 [Apatococcus fuscideae]|uniref:HMG box domain-containing protein n=1 Tax=Apatococcus fuscideae TaxID=2026836 RepID=A0AAW1TES1_9CHLO